eukprot:TRINITY_DN111011_c0_g1_i1.p1 TRINITY_DN111011_c0_g1~~TRINITY_DN111011_c0_g1_i1.p1  ORF type:complete len:523 (-),score=95.19 TRINITY_DN111011_c0_g1_i1:235-1803(-)
MIASGAAATGGLPRRALGALLRRSAGAYGSRLHAEVLARGLSGATSSSQATSSTSLPVPIPSTTTVAAGAAETGVDTFSQPRGLERYGRSELVFLLDAVSRAGNRDPKVWASYAKRVLGEVDHCSVEDLCSILSSFRRANFAKKAILKVVSRRLRKEAPAVSPRLLSQAVSDLRRLGYLSGPLLMALTRGADSRLIEFDTFDLPLLLHAFAQVSMRDESRVAAIGQVLQSRGRELSSTSVATALYALSLLDCGNDGTANRLALSLAPRRLTDASGRDLTSMAFSLVILDLPAGELLSFILERLTRHAEDLRPVEVHALRIVDYCLRLPSSLRPAMQQSFLADPATQERAHQAMDQIAKIQDGVKIPYAVCSSKLQRHLSKYFDRLELPHLGEGVVGPYTLDFVLPGKVAIEVDGYKHYYAFSRRLTAKSQLKLRLLEAMGWNVVSLPHFEWLPKREDERLAYLAEAVQNAAGMSLSALRREAASGEEGWKLADDPSASRSKGRQRWLPRSQPPQRAREARRR